MTSLITRGDMFISSIPSKQTDKQDGSDFEKGSSLVADGRGYLVYYTRGLLVKNILNEVRDHYKYEGPGRLPQTHQSTI